MHIDLLSVSGHKIHGPKGVGLLYVGDKVKIQPIVFGGGQQQNLRSGTENVPGIAGLAKAAEMLYSRFDEDHARLCACKRRFIEGVRELDQVTVNGLLPDAPYGEGTAAHIVSVSLPASEVKCSCMHWRTRESMYRREVPAPHTNRSLPLH